MSGLDTGGHDATGYAYPDSPTYTRRQFDELARAYVYEEASIRIAADAVGMNRHTAALFLRTNGLLRSVEESQRIAAHRRSRFWQDERCRKARRALYLRTKAKLPNAKVAEIMGVDPRSVQRYVAIARELGLTT